MNASEASGSTPNKDEKLGDEIAKRGFQVMNKSSLLEAENDALVT
jgi:hypothetical protein